MIRYKPMRYKFDIQPWWNKTVDSQCIDEKSTRFWAMRKLVRWNCFLMTIVNDLDVRIKKRIVMIRIWPELLANEAASSFMMKYSIVWVLRRNESKIIRSTGSMSESLLRRMVGAHFKKHQRNILELIMWNYVINKMSTLFKKFTHIECIFLVQIYHKKKMPICF